MENPPGYFMVVPMKNQYEQHCNTAALKKVGVTVLKKLKKKSIINMEQWMDESSPLDISFPDITKQAVEQLMEIYGTSNT